MPTPPHFGSHTLTFLTQTIGFAIFGLYIAQVTLGALVHFVRIPFPFLGHRPPQNYIHALLGLTILAMAEYQVRSYRRNYQREFFSLEF